MKRASVPGFERCAASRYYAAAERKGRTWLAGRIILLNGSSSAGKTTLAITLQQLLPDPWHHIALDQFRDGMGGRYRGLNSPPGTPGARGLNVVPVAHGNERVTEVRFGDLGKQVLRGMRRAIAAFAAEGNNVIIDDLMFEPAFLFDYVDALDGLRRAVRRRAMSDRRGECARSETPGPFSRNRDIALRSRSQSCVYDIEVDTGIASPRQCAEQIIARLNAGKRKTRSIVCAPPRTRLVELATRLQCARNQRDCASTTSTSPRGLRRTAGSLSFGPGRGRISVSMQLGT